jgi:hypothetical protein
MRRDERMTVNLCRPSFSVKQASVIPFHKIVCLTKLFPEQSVEFVWKGEILIQKMTFVFYRIAPHSSIVVLPNESAQHQTTVSEWMAATRDADAFNERIGFCVNPQTRAEVARLRDLRFWRCETRGIAALGGVGLYNFNDPIGSIDRGAQKLNTRFDPPSGPSCEPLPNPWKGDAIGPVIGGTASETVHQFFHGVAA